MAYVELLREKYPDCRIDDITGPIEGMRLINSAEEIDIIRIATEIADYGMQTYLSEANLGMTEIEMAGRVTLAMAKFAASKYPDMGITFNCYSQQGIHSLEPHAAASGHPLTPGQLMCVVVEASVAHYMAAVERTVGLGDIRPDQQHYFEAVVSSLQKTIEKCTPGTPMSEVDKVAQTVFRDAGYENFLCGTGLSRGLLNSFEGRIDKSNLRVYNNNPLRPNMVLSIEPYAIAPGVGAQRHCEMVLITETGNEVLSQAPNGFLRID
jgi:Xaa-Pro aminopeptidase